MTFCSSIKQFCTKIWSRPQSQKWFCSFNGGAAANFCSLWRKWGFMTVKFLPILLWKALAFQAAWSYVYVVRFHDYGRLAMFLTTNMFFYEIYKLVNATGLTKIKTFNFEVHMDIPKVYIKLKYMKPLIFTNMQLNDVTRQWFYTECENDSIYKSLTIGVTFTH